MGFLKTMDFSVEHVFVWKTYEKLTKLTKLTKKLTKLTKNLQNLQKKLTKLTKNLWKYTYQRIIDFRYVQETSGIFQNLNRHEILFESNRTGRTMRSWCVCTDFISAVIPAGAKRAVMPGLIRSKRTWRQAWLLIPKLNNRTIYPFFYFIRTYTTMKYNVFVWIGMQSCSQIWSLQLLHLKQICCLHKKAFTEWKR